jgi:hypothetical protein
MDLNAGRNPLTFAFPIVVIAVFTIPIPLTIPIALAVSFERFPIPVAPNFSAFAFLTLTANPPAFPFFTATVASKFTVLAVFSTEFTLFPFSSFPTELSRPTLASFLSGLKSCVQMFLEFG